MQHKFNTHLLEEHHSITSNLVLSKHIRIESNTKCIIVNISGNSKKRLCSISVKVLQHKISFHHTVLVCCYHMGPNITTKLKSIYKEVATLAHLEEADNGDFIFGSKCTDFIDSVECCRGRTSLLLQ